MSKLKHLAIIMDGNGRWAKARGHNRFFGHVRGARVARQIIEAAVERKIPYLTLYTFSSENWNRPQLEVTFLMRLLKRHLNNELQTLQKNNIRFRVIGEMDKLPGEARKIVQETMDATKNNTGMTLTFALSYGARQEIRQAIQKIAKQVQSGHLDTADIDENMISACLETAYMPDPDLVIRTSGESRLSNFLLWQVAYSELHITNTLWPDFTVTELDEALTIFSGTERRFGRIPEGVDAPTS